MKIGQSKNSKISRKQIKIVILGFLAVVFLFNFVLNQYRSPAKMLRAVFGSLQGELSPSANDLFSCAGRNDCPDDVDSTFAGPQHKYVAQSYDKFGFPLMGVKYKWTKDDKKNLIKFRELAPAGAPSDESLVTTTENDQEIYVQPNDQKLEDGSAVVSVTGYVGDVAQGKTKSINVDLYYCLNTWPNTATFPFEDSGSPLSNPFTNFKTYYCKDRGAIDPNDDYPALKVVERSSGSSSDFMCSGGGGNGLKCSNDYLIDYNSGWDKFMLGDDPMPVVGDIPNISSVDTIGFDGKGANTMLLTSGYRWAMWAGGWGSGDILSSIPFAVWPDGPKTGTPLKPTALGMNGNNIILIEDNFIKRSNTGGTNWLTGPATLSEEGWPVDVQLPDEISLFSKDNPDPSYEYLMAIKNDYYRIYSANNQCNASKKCQTTTNRTWGSCSADSDCYWGERFSLYESREWPTTIPDWSKNIKFPIKAIALDGTGGDVALMSSSCEHSKGTCLLKEFLLISNPACSDKIDNDNDGQCDWGGASCADNLGNVVAMPADTDCADINDNSEGGTCNDGIDNDNDGQIDYTADFSCSSYSGVEENGCTTAQCCNNIDDDNDGLTDQQDLGCANNTDNTEANGCSDNIDNDNDGLTDVNDPGCADSSDDSEKGVAQCDDGIDNDGDGKCDRGGCGTAPVLPMDPECSGPDDNNEGA